LLSDIGEIGEYARDEVASHLRTLVSGVDGLKASKALLLCLNMSALWAIGAEDGHVSRLDLMAGSAERLIYSVEFACDEIRGVLERVGRVNLWLSLEAARRGCIDVSEALRFGGLDVLFCASGTLDDGTLLERMAGSSDLRGLVLAFELLRNVLRAVDRDLSDETISALESVGREFRKGIRRGNVALDAGWIGISGLEDEVVHATYAADDADPSDDPWSDDDDLVAEADGQVSAALADSAPKLANDALLGALCIMAVAVEVEGWAIYDYSEDQFAELQLGALSPAAPVLLSRLVRGLDPRVESLALTADDKSIIENWAMHRLNFTR
jgi:hypothetical protein